MFENTSPHHTKNSNLNLFIYVTLSSRDAKSQNDPSVTPSDITNQRNLCQWPRIYQGFATFIEVGPIKSLRQNYSQT